MSDRPTRFRRDSENPLDTDLVVVDEASMVDLALLSKLLAAIPKDAQLILLGDEDQLSSVEVGAILGDICRSSRRSEPSAAPIAECIFRLEQSHRFGADSAIGALAGAIRSGDSEAALEVLLDPSQTDARLEPSPDSVGLPASLRQLVLTHYPAYLAAAEPESRAKAFGQFRILCAHRAGLRGVEAANRDVERVLASAGLLSPKATWYHGQPIMVRENDYDLELYNGDTGFISLDADGEVRAHFVSGDGRLRSWNPARLPSHDTVFAMTIHKSQGSEMDHVGILLPNQVSPVLSRELLYTAITRAKQTVRVFAPPKVIRAAIDLPVQRASGLTDRLWNTPGAEVDRSPDNS